MLFSSVVCKLYIGLYLKLISAIKYIINKQTSTGTVYVSTGIISLMPTLVYLTMNGGWALIQEAMMFWYQPWSSLGANCVLKQGRT